MHAIDEPALPLTRCAAGLSRTTATQFAANVSGLQYLRENNPRWNALDRRPLARQALSGCSYSVGFRLYLDDVGIGAGTVAVIRPYPVVIIRVPRQPGNVSTRRVADVQILVSGHISNKSRARGDIQPVTSRVAHTAPLGGEAVGSDITGPCCLRSCRCTRRRRSRCSRCRGCRSSRCGGSGSGR